MTFYFLSSKNNISGRVVSNSPKVISLNVQKWHSQTTKYFTGRVTLFFANNYLTKYRITMEFLRNFLNPDVIFNSHTMYFNAFTKDFTPIHLVTFSIWHSRIRMQFYFVYSLIRQ